MSALLHPIHGASEKCRPKHQVLVLRCYPKFQKNVHEVKPNSSELSYLLYYASSRRTKLQKVGAFLEKKTATDVWRVRLGNVQVTLQILTSIIEKVPRDLSLYAGSVLTILDTVLQSKDINMVEESLPTFEAYCKHLDVSSLAADQHRTGQYESLIRQYTAFASGEPPKKSKVRISLPESLRWRTIALRAVRAAVGSDALLINPSNQLNIVMPAILQNLNLEKEGGLAGLQQRAQSGEKQSMEMARRRRMSTTTITTVDETDPNVQALASETTADADKAAEQEVRVLAVRCLKQIFSISTSSSRGQLRVATAMLLRFIAANAQPRPVSRPGSGKSAAPDWASSLFETIARWTPVQDRFVIVITALEILVRSPIVESILEKQLILATLVDWLLRSDINLIGLSVMDVLLGLVRHTLLLLQLGGRDSTTVPQSQHADVLGFYRDAQQHFDPTATATEPERGRVPDRRESIPSPVRIELLAVLQKAISDLATHIYYTDQISDMMTAILARLKPSPQSEIGSIAAAINDPAGATKALAESANLQEDPSTDGFFSFTTARIAALKAVKDILITANSRRTSGGVSAEARSRVGVQVWDGTQWLLKDEDSAVRVAYVDAIITWLKLETNKSDLILPRDGTRKPKPGKKDASTNGEISIAKRAVSNASRREKPAKSTFLQMLHLAIYDSALDRAENEADIQLLYILLWTLVERLGVNAVRTGLPMMLNLQDTVLHETPAKSQLAKVHIASLVHGYLLAVSEKFDFETSAVGNDINAEVSRRKRFGCWYNKIKLPPTSLSQIIHTSLTTEKEQEVSQEAVDSIRPFLNTQPFVDEIANAYDTSLLSPPSSPPLSPGRVFSVPTLGFGYGYNAAPVAKPSRDGQLPQKVKDEMCGQWSRDSCIAAVDKENNPSVTGSRTGGSSAQRNLLTVQTSNESASGRVTPNNAADLGGTSPGAGPNNGLAMLFKNRNFSSGSSLKDLDSSSRDSTVRVADLKRALAGTNGDVRTESPLRQPVNRSRPATRSSVNESMLSWNSEDDGSDLEVPSAARMGSIDPAKSTKHASSEQNEGANQGFAAASADPRLGDDIPPVPKIPSTLNLPGTWPRDPSPVRRESLEQDKAEVDSEKLSPPTKFGSKRDVNTVKDATPGSERSKRRTSRPASRAGASSIFSDRHHTAIRTTKTDLKQFLAEIGPSTGANAGEKESFAHRETLPVSTASTSRRGVIKPPY